ncbi:type II secretion system protein [Kiritimatiellota bacterium B12222]|nr:type II secretion system protein [Kiritimatiellota bacterium B12222]
MQTSVTCTKQGFTLLEVLMALVVIAVLAAFLSRILQSALLHHKLIEDDLLSAPARQEQVNFQLSGQETEAGPLIELIPVEKEEE